MGLMDSFKHIFSIKYGALALLVLQNTFLVVFMHYSRVVKGPLYASSTAVAVMETVKLVTCLLVIGFSRGGIIGLFSNIHEEILSQPIELVKLSVPSLLYTVQNNLLYYALSHLDAATFQVGYQVKILTTAVFSVLMLGKSLSRLQWLSLIVLTLGVSMAQLSTSNSDEQKANTTAGFVAVLLAACTSGFSGVYFERILKNSKTSLWMRNVQMCVSSIPVALMGVLFSSDWPIVRDNGFFYGYTGIVWWVIMLQAIGGLVVAVVVKYADNILKGFAASFSIVTSCILTYFMFDFHPTGLFLVGAVLVNLSMYMYSHKSAAAAKDKRSEYPQPLVRDARGKSSGTGTATVGDTGGNMGNLSSLERGGSGDTGPGDNSPGYGGLSGGGGGMVPEVSAELGGRAVGVGGLYSAGGGGGGGGGGSMGTKAYASGTGSATSAVGRK